MAAGWRGLLAGLACALSIAAPAAAVEPPEVLSGRLLREGGALVAEVTIEPGWHVNAHEPRDRFLIPTELTVAPPAGVVAGPVEYPSPVERKLAFSEAPLLLYEGTVRMRVPLAGDAPGAFAASLRYQACDDARCLPPRTLALAFDGAGSGAGSSDRGNDVAGWLARWGLGPTLAWVALLGLALNLTPCVYPLISVTVAFFGGRSGQPRERTLFHACCYVLGICFTFSILGVVAALTGSLFGAALQRPEVTLVIVALMVLLALSNFGLYQFRLPSALMQAAGRAGEGAGGAFFMGLTMGIVGAPCIGPIVAALLVFVGTTQSALLGFAFFFALGLGMGMPYVGLALAADRLRRLPRGGSWLGWMEWLFGFVLLGLALHFATPLLAPATVTIAWAALLLVAGLALGFRPGFRQPVARWGVRMAGMLVAVLGVLGAVRPERAPDVVWVPLSEQSLAAAQAQARPMLVDFQAAWCLPCRKMERTTFVDPAFVETARNFSLLKADVTEQDEIAEALMERFTVVGVPTYVLLAPDGRELRRFESYVDADDMVAAMREALEAGRG